MYSDDDIIDMWTTDFRSERPVVLRAFRDAGIEPNTSLAVDFDTEDYLVVTADGRVLEAGYEWIDGYPGMDIQDEDQLSKLPLLIEDLTDEWQEHPFAEMIAIALGRFGHAHSVGSNTPSLSNREKRGPQKRRWFVIVLWVLIGVVLAYVAVVMLLVTIYFALWGKYF